MSGGGPPLRSDHRTPPPSEQTPSLIALVGIGLTRLDWGPACATRQLGIYGALLTFLALHFLSASKSWPVRWCVQVFQPLTSCPRHAFSAPEGEE